jgi:hypothetical protein
MSNYAVVLQKKNLVVKASNFGDVVNIKFTKDGKVAEFVRAGKTYYAIYQYNSTYFIEYVEKDKFELLIENERKKEKDKYDGVDISLWKDLIFNEYKLLDKAIVNDDIFGVLRDDTGLCFYFYTWKYTNNYTEPVEPVNAFYPPVKAPYYNCDDFSNNPNAQIFYNDLKDKAFYDLETNTSKKDPRLVAEVADLIRTVNSQMLSAFNEFTQIVGEHGGFKIIDNVTNTFYRNVLVTYRDGLRKWLQLYNQYKNELKNLKKPEQLYIICDLLYKYNMLGLLTVDQKISILLTFCTRPLMNWYFASFKDGFQHRETLVVRVIQSVTINQASDFLEKLISTKIELPKPNYYYYYGSPSTVNKPQFTEMCLYRVLFSKIDDYFGLDNFTLFIKTLQRLVLAKHNILLPEEVNKIDYSLEQLAAKTDKLFMWGNIKNENKVKYSVKSKTNEKITYIERICSKINKVEIQNSNSLGIPTNSSYTIAICEDHEEKEIEVNHFDLVGIVFFDNPSFIDLGEATSFVDQRFLTFGGFVDYLLEKENTKLVEKVIVAGLTVLSMAIGVGEIVAFMRGASYLRLLAGIGILTGDTVAYLAQDTEFRNYIIQKYPQDHDTILTVLMWAGIILSAGGSSAVGSGILKTYSAKQAAEFIGIAEQVVLEPLLYAKLTANEKAILENGIKIFENGLYRIKYDAGLAEIVNRSKSTIKFYDNSALRAEIFALEEMDKLRFLNKTSDLSNDLTRILKEFPEAVIVWSKTNNIGRNAIEKNFEAWLKSFSIRPLLKNKQYNQIASLYGSVVSESYEVASLPGIRWVVDSSTTAVDDAALIKAFEIANDTSDIAIIASNYDIPLPIMQRVKNHYWVDEHFVLADDGTFKIGRFEKIDDYNNEWISAKEKTLSFADEKIFRNLIAHEYIEAKLIDNGMNFRSFKRYDFRSSADFGAHDLAPIINNGEYYDLGRLSNPPFPVTSDFSNLDEIVEFYIDFYKL